MSTWEQIDDFICERLTEVKYWVSTETVDIEMLVEFIIFCKLFWSVI